MLFLFGWLILVAFPISGALQANDYLSDEHFPGLHVLELVETEVYVYKDGKRPAQGEAQVTVTAGWKSMGDARAAFEAALGIPPLEPLQTPWAFFDVQGTRVEQLPELLKLKVAFILLIGQWMWPAVRVGFEQQAEGVLHGASVTLRTLSLRPVVFEVKGFILPEEADEVIKIGQTKNMVNSQGTLVTADKLRNRRHDEYRTSTQAWLSRGEAPTILALDDRTANLTRVPAEHNEPVQLLRYGEGQFYHSHLDWSDLTLYNGQQAQWQANHFGWEGRMATLFWYLNDVETGGHTVFPKHGQPICPDYSGNCKGAWHPSPKTCDVGLQVPPKKGSVILWYNFHPNGRGDQNALHGGCPPAPGLDKWSGNKWIHIKSLKVASPNWMPGHPGLTRFGWRSDAMKEEAQNGGGCKLKIRSDYDSPLTLHWVNPSDGSLNRLGTLESQRDISMNSFDGHKFVLDAGNVKSADFACSGKESLFQVTSELKVLATGANWSEL